MTWSLWFFSHDTTWHESVEEFLDPQRLLQLCARPWEFFLLVKIKTLKLKNGTQILGVQGARADRVVETGLAFVIKEISTIYNRWDALGAKGTKEACSSKQRANH